MRVLRSLAIAACLTAPFFGAGAVLANDDGPDCHGNNEAECRPDPNDHGQDCDEHGQHGESNDDHCATTTTTGLVTLPTNSTTTTTRAPFVSPPDVTTTTLEATTTTLAMTPATTTTVPTAVLGTQVEKLPTTGFPIAFCLAVGLLCLLLGGGAIYASRIESRG